MADDSDQQIKRKYVQKVLDKLRDGKLLKVDFRLKALRKGQNILYKDDIKHLIQLVKLSNSPILITGTTTRTCIDSMDKLKAKYLSAPQHHDTAHLASLKKLLISTTTVFNDDDYLNFISSNDYQKNYNLIHKYELSQNSLSFNQNELNKDDNIEPDFNETQRIIESSNTIDTALDLIENDIDLEFEFEQLPNIRVVNNSSHLRSLNKKTQSTSNDDDSKTNNNISINSINLSKSNIIFNNLKQRYFNLIKPLNNPDFNPDSFDDISLINDEKLNFINFITCYEDDIELFTNKVANEQSHSSTSNDTILISKPHEIEKNLIINNIFREIVLFQFPITEHVFLPLLCSLGLNEPSKAYDKIKFFIKTNFIYLYEKKIINDNGQQIKYFKFLSKNRKIPNSLQFKNPSQIRIFRRKRRKPPTQPDLPPNKRRLIDENQSEIPVNQPEIPVNPDVNSVITDTSNNSIYQQNQIIMQQNKQLLQLRSNNFNNNPNQDPLQKLININKAGINCVCVDLKQKKEFNTRIAELRTEEIKDTEFDAIKACLNGKNESKNASNSEILSKIEGLYVLLLLYFFFLYILNTIIIKLQTHKSSINLIN